jgi:hypothetical protein
VDAYLPSPPGVEFVEAFHDDLTDEWGFDKYPVACLRMTDGEMLDAMSVSGEWLGGEEKALLLADGRVVLPLNAVFPDTAEWLSYVRREHEKFMKGTIRLAARG